MRPTGIKIFVPAYQHQMYAETCMSIYTTAQFLAAKKIHNKFSWMSAADIEDIRNLVITTWYDKEPEFSHLLFVGADMGFEPELIRDFIRFDKPLVGCLYARRNKTPSIVGTAPEGHGLKDVIHGFLPSSGMGCGVMMIDRSVVTKMLEVFPELSDETPSTLMQSAPEFKLTRIIRAFDKIRTPNVRLSEDMSFCYRWQACGGELWANVRHKISHIGPFDYCMRYEGILESKDAPAKAAA